MAKATCILFFVLAVSQVFGEYVKPEFIENAQRRDGRFVPLSSRIVSGWESYPGQHPHQVSQRQVSFAGAVTACGGSIVSREWVITAAHCVAQSVAVVIRAGIINMTQPSYISETTEWYNHPEYDTSIPSIVQPNDITILKLTPAVVYNDFIKPIRVQSSADAFRDYNGDIVYASGWGATWTGGSSPEILNWVYLRGVSNFICANTFGSAIVQASTICAQWYNVTSQSTCQGDSGGPLVHVGPEGPVLIGVSSFVAGTPFGCHSGFPAAFVRPGPYLSWFEEVTGIDFENLDESEPEESITQEPEIVTLEPQGPTTQEPEIVTLEPQGPTTQEPEIVTLEPQGPTTQEPEIVTLEPQGPTTQEPEIVTLEPQGPTTQEPEIVTLEPQGPTTQEPEIVTLEPQGPTTQEPEIVTLEPQGPTTQEPEIVTLEPQGPTTQEPDVPTTEEPEIVTLPGPESESEESESESCECESETCESESEESEEIEESVTEPVTTPEVPVTITELPVTTTEIPITTTELPVTTPEVPVTTTEAPVTITELPVTTPEIPVTATEAPATTISYAEDDTRYYVKVANYYRP